MFSTKQADVYIVYYKTSYILWERLFLGSETYQHVLPAFISAWVAVEMLSKSGLHMSAFILQHNKQMSTFIMTGGS